MPVIINEFSISEVSPSFVKINWNITGVYEKIVIYRKFLYKDYILAVVGNNVTSFEDIRVDYGTNYTYYIKIFNKNVEIMSKSQEIVVVTTIDENSIGRPLFNWTEYRDRKMPFRSKDYLAYSEEEFDIFSYYMHGVQVKVIIDKQIESEYKQQFAAGEFNFFNRYWYKLKAFPINEYRIVVEVGGQLQGEDELGLLYGPEEINSFIEGFGEKQNHEIGHAWFGGIIMMERNIGGNDFDPVTQDSDKWLIEAFNTLFGILGISEVDAISLLNYQIQYYENMILTGIDKPLVDLAMYTETTNIHSLYAKSALFAFYIYEKLYQTVNKTLNQFSQHLYNEYNLTTDDRTPENLLSTEDLLLELNAFSGLNFTDDFQKYVYGIEEMPVLDYNFFDPQKKLLLNILRITNEDITPIYLYQPKTITETESSSISVSTSMAMTSSDLINSSDTNSSDTNSSNEQKSQGFNFIPLIIIIPIIIIVRRGKEA